jgi:UDP-glucose 4-epimerase
LLTSYATAHGFAAVSLRYFNVAGAAYGFGERHSTETHLIPIALQVAAGTRASLTIYGDDYPTPDGTCIRDYVHVADLADAHLLALPAPAAGEHRIYNLGNGNGTGFSVQEVIDAVRQVTGHPVPVVVGERRAGDPAQLVASSDRIRADLGWTPKHTDLADIVRDAWKIAGRN